MTGVYDLRLVALSLIVAIIASYTARALTDAGISAGLPRRVQGDA